MERLDEFCESQFWDFNTVWNTTNPDFTECFQKTVLVWIPCGFLWLFASLEIRWLAKSTNRRIPWTGLNILKLVISIFLIILTVAEIGYSIDRYSNGEPVPLVDYYTPFIKFVTLLLATLFIFLERRKGVPATSVTFIFWFLMGICGVFSYRSILMKALDETTTVDQFFFIVQMIVYPLVIGEVILNSFSDAIPKEKKDMRPCPELYASFVSRVTFSWFGGMALKGYRSPLEKEDLWSMNSDNECGRVFDVFNSYWKKDLRKAHSGRRASQAKFLASGEDVTFTGRIPKSFKPSILMPLCKTFGANFLLGSCFKLVSDLLVFVNPMILQLLIDFASGNEPAWRGYLYVVLIFSASMLQFVFLGQYFYIIFLIGLRVRSAVISAIYRKALRLSNASKKTSTVGEIVNLMSVDAQRLMDLNMHLNLLWSAPLQIALAMYFLWQSLGPSVLSGLAILILLIPVNAMLASKIKKLQMQQMKKKDQRIKMMNEVLNGMKVLKLNAWEESFYEKINTIRNQELRVLKKSAYLSAFTSFVFLCAPFMVMLATFTTYVLISDTNILTASKAFVSLSLFNILRAPMVMLPTLIVGIVQAVVSLKRINKYMTKEEIDPTSISHESKDAPLSIDSGTFSWGPDEDPVLSNVNLSVPKGSLVAVVGPVGAGKSSLLAALLGEMDKLQGSVNTIGTVAYVPQQAWIQNTSLKNNIVFANTLDNDRYRSVIDGCALRADLDILPGGDETEIGEKGINLSGGQKQRVSLARAVYADLDNYLLDDPLSAVDSHVGKHIFNKIIGPDGLLRGKTRILVTHGITYLSKVDMIVVLKDGTISEIGTYNELLDKKGAFAEFLMTYLTEGDNDESIEELQELKDELLAKMGSEVDGQLSRQLSRALSNMSYKSQKSYSEDAAKSPSRQLSLEKGDNTVADGAPAGVKLVTKEATETGKVDLSVYKYYMKSIGLWLALATAIFNVGAQSCAVGSNIWLSEWSNDKPNPDGTQDTEQRDLRLGVYGTLGFLQSVGILIGMLVLAKGSVRASSVLHTEMCYNVLRSPMSFFDTTPLGRIVNRFARDIDVLDNVLFINIRSWLSFFLQAISTLVVISISTPIFLVTVLPIGAIFYFIQVFYISTSRQLKRLESVSRSPIYSHFSETITGAVTIRAYNRQREFIRQSDTAVDQNQICYFPSIIANRWLAFRLEVAGMLVVTSAALFAVLGRETLDPGTVGLSLSYALSVTTALIWMVRMSSELETNIVAIERIKEYTETPQEAAWCIEDPKPPPSWPDEGFVTFSDYKTKYREGLVNVLHGVSCTIKANEKVGIAGRTGAGKSSLTLALFRIIEPVAGNIVIDGVDVTKIGLHDLRAKLTIIPQDPVLFSGTLRMNLDPFNRHTDLQLWQSLENSHLKIFVTSLQMGLEHEISEGGENLSVGQRQLVCLARALLRKTKVLVLDEATAAVDLETDDLIQTTIRKEFADCTIITIAHRLNTIMDNDRIMVLDQGRIREFAAPKALLENKESIFYSMAKDAGLI